MRKAAFTA